MECGFNMELTSQREWSWLLAIDLYLGGLGGGLFLLFQFFSLPIFVAILALVLVALGALVLLSELGHPLRAWRAIFRLRTSWISRGVLFVSLFLGAGSLYVASTMAALPWLPWAGDSLGAGILWLIAGFCAVFVILYPGFILSASPAVPFWNTPLLPVLFLTHSVMGAGGVVLLVSPLIAFEASLGQIESLVSLLIVANLFMIFIYLLNMNHSGRAAKEAVRLLTNRGPLGWTFGIGTILVGMLLPLLVVVWLPSGVVVAGAGILIGALLFRYCVLKAGVYVPFPLL